MIRLNSHVGPVRTQMNNTQKMNHSEMSTQNIPNLRVCYMEEIKLKIIKVDKSELCVYSMDKSESKRVIVNACSSEKIESKSVHISVNTSEVKDAMNEY